MIWKLKGFLKENQITPNALAVHLRGRLSKTAVYNLVGSEPPTGVHFATLDMLIPALTDLTGQTVSLSDLLEYREKSREWENYFGSIDLTAEPKD